MHALHLRALSSMGRPWQSQPGTYLTRRPCSIWYFMMMSFNTCAEENGFQTYCERPSWCLAPQQMNHGCRLSIVTAPLLLQ